MKTGSPDPSIISRPTSRWPLERVLFAMAGTVVLLSALLAALVSPWFLLLTAFVGLSQWAYVATRACPASLLLQRFGVEAQCEW
jgi:hypothetical protein